jgi:hypothetical protein
LALLIVAALNRQSDGLWFQGDAPRHAANGLFWWDLLTALPRDPIEYAVRYYARYPVIAPATYPPFFYALEGLAFAIFGPSPYTARFIVLVFAGMAGLYTLEWSRRWVAPLAGWAGAFLAFVPGIVLWSNTVMLNVPAVALGLALLYHFRRWLESARTSQLVLAAVFAAAGLVTYYPGASVFSVIAAWWVLSVRRLRFDRKLLWIAAIVSLALMPLLAALRLGPVHLARHLPSAAFLVRLGTWTYYWRMLPTAIGWLASTMALIGCAAGLASERWRSETVVLMTWIVALAVGLSVVPARDPRYILLAAPACVVLAAIGFACLFEYLPPLDPPRQAALLAAGLAVGVWSAARIEVPHVSGFREVVAYLREQASDDAVLYDGEYDGLFGYYFRASDPDFRRRLARADKLLYQYAPISSFRRNQVSYVSSVDDVVSVLRTHCGCRWVAIEVTTRPNPALGARLLREAVQQPAFELVRTFPIAGSGTRRVDVYRLVGRVEPVQSVDLDFPSFTNRHFDHVVPITRP